MLAQMKHVIYTMYAESLSPSCFLKKKKKNKKTSPVEKFPSVSQKKFQKANKPLINTEPDKGPH